MTVSALTPTARSRVSAASRRDIQMRKISPLRCGFIGDCKSGQTACCSRLFRQIADDLLRLFPIRLRPVTSVIYTVFDGKSVLKTDDLRGEGMSDKHFFQAIAKFVFGLLLFAVLLFVPAGTLKYPNGWLLISVLFIPMFIAGIILLFRNPDLLKKRLNAKEEENEQKAVVALSGMMFLAAFVVAGLNFRFRWFILPNWAVITGTVIFLLAYAVYAEVLRENTYLSRTIEVQENQKVIDTGLYGVVRHPMYAATLFLFLSMGIVLGSLFSFAILLLYVPIIAKRIRNEEKFLEEGLEGYSEYKARVRYKVIPFIW